MQSTIQVLRLCPHHSASLLRRAPVSPPRSEGLYAPQGPPVSNRRPHQRSSSWCRRLSSGPPNRSPTQLKSTVSLPFGGLPTLVVADPATDRCVPLTVPPRRHRARSPTSSPTVTPTAAPPSCLQGVKRTPRCIKQPQSFVPYFPSPTPTGPPTCDRPSAASLRPRRSRDRPPTGPRCECQEYKKKKSIARNHVKCFRA